MPEMEIFLLLFLVAIVAGWVDTIAGGGGLLTLPALLLSGMEPSSALATNKLQSSAGTFTAAYYFVKKKYIDLSSMKGIIFLTFIGSMFGSWLILQIDSRTLILFLPFFLIAMGTYTLFSAQINDREKKKRISTFTFMLFVAPLLGFYDGLLGPGTGSLISLSYVALLGYGLSNATAHAKVLNFTSNISSLIFFSIFGKVSWSIGLVMVMGQYIGASIGAKMIEQKGAKLIKPLIIIMCFTMSLSLIMKQQ